MAKADSSNNPWPHMDAPMNLAQDVALRSSESPSVPVHLTSAQGANAKKSKKVTAVKPLRPAGYKKK